MGHDISLHTNWGHLSVRAAGIVLRNNCVLLAKGENTPYYLVGGTVQLYENSKDTVRREFYEELGVEVTVERLVFVQERLFTVQNEKHHEIAFFYKIQDS
jgi:ADP-ribose pyrophosphatase YjhB (NUDIX family)